MFNFAKSVGKLVANRSGGRSFEVDRWTRLGRVLILGTEGGTYYVSEHDLTREAIAVVDDCLKADGPRTVRTAVEISRAGRAPRNDYAIFVIARASVMGDELTRKAANDALSQVCRTGTHLFQWASLIRQMGKGFSYGRRRAVRQWYFDRKVENLVYQVIKYRQRKVNGQSWTHRDMMRLARPKVTEPQARAVTAWMLGGWEGDLDHVPEGAMERIWAFERAQRTQNLDELMGLIIDHQLPRECVPTRWFGHVKAARVWEALAAQGMPYTAMMRNLGNMTRIGYLSSGSDAALRIAQALADPDRIRRARIHPFNVLVALLTYKRGCGVRGSGTWTPLAPIVEALEAAFQLSFGNVPDVGKRWLIALDVSGSMCGPGLMGLPELSPRMASAAMSTILVETQKQVSVMGFSNTFTPINIRPGMRLDTVVRNVSGLPFGSTDCSLPFNWASDLWKRNKQGFDMFVVYTDNDTNSNRIDPHIALERYRDLTGIPARLVVQAMTADRFSIANPADPGMLDLCGLDSAAPRLTTDFAEGAF
ncbi:MAG: TROVE domain-containing protein [Myxococcota bacterium]